MSRKNWALVCFVLAFLIPLGFGLINYASSRLLPWHEAALGVPWDQVSPNMQAVYVAYMKIAGGGLIALNVAIAFILFIPYRRGEAWALWAIGAVAVVTPALIFYGLLSVQLKTGVPQPWYNPLFSLALCMIGFAITPKRTSTGPEAPVRAGAS